MKRFTSEFCAGIFFGGLGVLFSGKFALFCIGATGAYMFLSLLNYLNGNKEKS